MSVFTLLSSKIVGTHLQRTIPGGQALSVMSLDVTKSEILDADIELTDHPVEDGADISDHAIIKQRKLTIEGTMSSTPLVFSAAGIGAALGGIGVKTVAAGIGSKIGGALGPGLQAAGGTAIAGTVGTIGGALAGKSIAGLFGDSSGDRLQDTIKEFEHIRVSKTPLTIQTGLTVYKGFILTNYKITRDSSKQKIKCNLSFKELFVVASVKTTVKIPSILSAVDKAGQGRKVAEALSAEKGRSFLKFLTDSGGVTK